MPRRSVPVVEKTTGKGDRKDDQDRGKGVWRGGGKRRLDEVRQGSGDDGTNDMMNMNYISIKDCNRSTVNDKMNVKGKT